MRIIEKADKIVKLTQDQVIQALEIPCMLQKNKVSLQTNYHTKI